MTAPSIVQSITGEGPNPAETSVTSVSTTFASKTTAGNSIVVFRTLSDYVGIHQDLTATDTQSNYYLFLGQCNSNPAGGAATVSTHLASNIVGDTSSGETVTGGFSINGDAEDYQSIFIIEVGNAHPSPLVGHSENVQNALSPGTNNVTSGSIVVSAQQVPCIMLACSMNTSGNSGYVPPTVGTGMTQITTAWGFQSGTNTATFAYQVITTAGTYAATFNQASTAADDITTNAVILMANQSTLCSLKLAG